MRKMVELNDKESRHEFSHRWVAGLAVQGFDGAEVIKAVDCSIAARLDLDRC